jgi:hypothetical protein
MALVGDVRFAETEETNSCCSKMAAVAECGLISERTKAASGS